MSFFTARGSRVYTPGGQHVGVAAYAPGRTCAAEGCATILSAYNPSSRCALHDTHDAPRRRSRRQERPLEERACPQCGLVFETANTARRYCRDSCRVVAFQQRRKATGVQAHAT